MAKKKAIAKKTSTAKREGRKSTTKRVKAKTAVAGPPALYRLHIIAASTGDLVLRLGSVAATQFAGIDFELVHHPLVNTLERLEETLRDVTAPRSIVLHALADPDAKLMVRKMCVALRVPHFDLTGPLLHFIADCVGRLPDNDVTRLHKVDAAYQRRIEAMEFTVGHDDGLGLNSIQQADIVIVGVSRVSKSPTSLYLASRGFKTANVSVVPAQGFPKELNKISRKKIVAITSQPKRLHEIRRDRMRLSGVEQTSYDELSSVMREVMAAEQEYRRRRYPIIDSTQMTIEQIATHILQALQLTAP
ncbi:MAG: kinase/pyrophosphorylase [Planctomycetales bacterium]|nr:kinase/pyrophosphorylase [Planctomycetales bacterium]